MLRDHFILPVGTQQVPAEPPLGVPAPWVREPVTVAVDHRADRVVRPTEALLTESLFGHLQIMFGHLPLLLLLSPHLVELLLNDDLVMIS